MQTVTDPETAQQRLGRFGYKAVKARISHQVAGALNTDMGVATTVFPVLDGEINTNAVEVSAADLDKMTRYVALLGVAARRDLANSQALLGEHFATGAEWRTPPLWSIGLTAGVSGGEAYLHDGRARSLEEAILWHDGEGGKAKEAFRAIGSLLPTSALDHHGDTLLHHSHRQ